MNIFPDSASFFELDLLNNTTGRVEVFRESAASYHVALKRVKAYSYVFY